MTYQNPYPPKKARKKINIKRIMTLVGIIFLLGFVGVAVLVTYASIGMPAWDPNQLTGARTTFIFDDKDTQIAGLHAEQNRTEITLEKVPKDLVNAFIAIEDQDFYNHHGINVKGMIRAVFVNVKSGEKTQGASTITQQLARNAFLSSEKNWTRKIREILLSFKLESHYTKDEIMMMYLNKIYFGSGAYGVQAASRTYFGKNVEDLNLAESTLLAGLVQSPNAYDPLKYPDKAKNRQKLVLNNMVQCGFISKQKAEETASASLNFNSKVSSENNKYHYYTDAVIDEALDILKSKGTFDDPDDALYRSGLRIYTSMDSDLQAYAETLYTNPVYFPKETKGGLIVQSAMTVMDHKTGGIKALIGGRKYEQQRGFNRATSAYRQPGSSIKPITVYSPALEQGMMPFYVLDDSPLAIKVGGSIWRPVNYDGQYRGLITMRTGVQYSINTYAVQLLQKVGIRYSFDFANSMGLKLVEKSAANDLSLAPLALGGLTHGVTTVQMAGAYGAIGNGGVYIKPHLITKIESADGSEIYSFKPEYKRVMSEQTAWLMNSLLQSVVQSGTGTRAKVPGIPTCGKTGTSEEYSNSWFCGFTPEYSCAVWMGYDRQEYSMNHIYGGSWPAPLFRELLTRAHKHGGDTSFSMPDKIIRASVCSKSGKLPSDMCPSDDIITDYCRADAVPKEVCDVHEQVAICPESGKLAGKYCPHPQMRTLVRVANPNSVEKDRVPTETCDIHTTPSVDNMTGQKVAICTDPRHNGKLYSANIPREGQSGGCPSDEIQYINISPWESIPPPCPLEDHQIK